MIEIFKRYKTKTDEELFVLVAQGNEAAFSEIYKRYSERLLHFFYRMLGGDEQKAQDFLQDISIKIIEKAHTFRGDSKASTWLFSVASNMCRNEYRKNNRYTYSTNETLERHTHPDSNMEQKMESAAFQTLLEAELKSLDNTKREVFLLRFQEQMSVREISQIMECPEGTVKSRLFHATKELEKRLTPYRDQFFEV